jgi:hypothetical protein
MNNRSPEILLELLLEQERELPKKLKQITEAQKIISVFTQNMCAGLSADIDRVSVNYFTQSAYSKGSPNEFLPAEDDFFGAFQRYCKEVLESGDNVHFPIGGWWSSMEKFLKSPTKPECFFSLNPDGECVKSAGSYLVGYSESFYGNVKDLPERLVKHLTENNLEPDGPMFNIFLFDEVSTMNPEKYLLQASIKVK